MENTDIFDQMTDEDIKEYLADEYADRVLNSEEFIDRDFVDCALPA